MFVSVVFGVSVSISRLQKAETEFIHKVSKRLKQKSVRLASIANVNHVQLQEEEDDTICLSERACLYV